MFNLEAQEQVMPCGDKFSPMREAEGCVLPPSSPERLYREAATDIAPGKIDPHVLV